MSRGPSDLFSDVDRARRLSRRLRGTGAVAGAEAPALRFAAAAPPAAQGGDPPVELEVIREDDPGALIAAGDSLGSRFWNDLLTQSLEIARDEGARAAFAVDAQGLAIAQSGDLGGAEVESTGSRLMLAIDQAGKMEAFPGLRPGALQIDFGDCWLTGLQAECAGSAWVTLGIVSSSPLSSRSRALVAGLVSEMTSTSVLS